MKTRSFTERLDDKSAQALLTNHFRERYNYNPAMAEALFKDTVFVRTLLNPIAREDGQIIRYFPKAAEPAGKPLKNCEYVAVRLTWYASGDAGFLVERGPKALRQRRLKRICNEAAAQGAPATQEDLAVLCGCHRSTIIRDIAELKAQGREVITRGDVTDQGRGVTHKRPILKLYLLGWPPTEVAKRTGHTLESVENYVAPFFRVACLHSEGKALGVICRLTQLSRSLVEEYIALYQPACRQTGNWLQMRSLPSRWPDACSSSPRGCCPPVKKGGEPHEQPKRPVVPERDVWPRRPQEHPRHSAQGTVDQLRL